LQNQRRSHLVHYLAVLLPSVAGLVEDRVRLAGGQPLVPQVNGQAGQFAQFGGKGLCFGRTRAGLTGKMQRVAHHNSRHAESPAEPRQRAQIVPELAAPLEREHGLRREAQLVGDGNADAAAANIEAEIAGMRNSFQLLAPSY